MTLGKYKGLQVEIDPAEFAVTEEDIEERIREELLEIITWKQLGLYLNPIVILNVKNYFGPLLDMLRQAVDENFMRTQHGAIWHVAQTPQEAVELIYTTPLWDASIRKFAAI